MEFKFRPRAFFSLYYLFTWLPLWLAVLSMRAGKESLYTLCMVLTGVGGVAAALFLVYQGGSVIARDYWRRVWDFRTIGWQWWLVIFLFFPGLKALAVLISTGLGESLVQLQINGEFLASPVTFVLFYLLFGPVPEELAQRGYGLDSLRERMSGLSASLVLGSLWALWHLPLFFIPGSYHSGLLSSGGAVLAWLLPVAILTPILMTWLHYNTGRSTLAAILFHFMDNFSGEIFQLGILARGLVIALMLVPVILVVIRDSKTFSRPSKFHIRAEKLEAA